MANTLKLGIAGLGTVGVGVWKLLNENRDRIFANAGCALEITAVCARDASIDRGIDLSTVRWFDDADAMAKADDVDIFVELIGGEEGIAKTSVEAALASGKHVVTANKALLAHHGNELAALAESHDVALNYEAAIAGAIPIVKSLREGLAGNDVASVVGILNGTCNYILTKMASEGREFADVLAEAQEMGYAEADPTFDVGGHDTAHKLAILTCLAFGTKIDFDAVYLEGIEAITQADLIAAQDLGYCIKLLGVAVRTDTGIEQRVHPSLVPISSPIAAIDGAFNAVAVDGNYAGKIILQGAGAGQKPTASAVIADIIDIARVNALFPLGREVAKLAPYKRARMRAHEGGYYIGLSVYDHPGAVAAIAKRFAEQDISLESIIQRGVSVHPGGKEGGNKDTVGQQPVVLITHETAEAALREALASIEADGHIADHPRMIRIEKTI